MSTAGAGGSEPRLRALAARRAQVSDESGGGARVRVRGSHSPVYPFTSRCKAGPSPSRWKRGGMSMPWHRMLQILNSQ
eukprot:scaffold18666_cov116-Isochrysis_galbana.AAC.2